MNFSNINYMHIERLGTDEVEGLLDGEVYIFPKIDGTNGFVCYDKESGDVVAGSRKRFLTFKKDNAGFYNFISNHKNIKSYLSKNQDRILYGEWLVPHTIKTYNDNCWRQFYVFDVGVMENGKRTHYISYEEYKNELAEYKIPYLTPLAIIKNPTIEEIKEISENNFVMMKEGSIGEGVVCKNYEFYNKYGRRTWGKYVRNEFKENKKGNVGNKCADTDFYTVEEKIVNEYVTQSFVDKEFNKIRISENGWSSKLIPRLLDTTFYSLITEECWHFIKKYKFPNINFNFLRKLTYAKIKELKPEIF